MRSPSVSPRSDEFDPLQGEFEEFFRQVYSRAVGITRLRATGIDYEGLVQDAMAVAWQHYLAGGELTQKWFFNVLWKKTGNVYKARRRDRVIVDTDLLDVALGWAEYGWVDEDGVSEPSLRVREAISKLRPTHRDTLLAVFILDLSYPDAAGALGISEATLRVRILRAKKALAKELGDSAR